MLSRSRYTIAGSLSDAVSLVLELCYTSTWQVRRAAADAVVSAGSPVRSRLHHC